MYVFACVCVCTEIIFIFYTPYVSYSQAVLRLILSILVEGFILQFCCCFVFDFFAVVVVVDDAFYFLLLLLLLVLPLFDRVSLALVYFSAHIHRVHMRFMLF